jgi:hypothetical protein
MAGTPAQEVRNGQICPGTPECRGLCYDLIIIHKIFGLIELNFFDRDPRCAERLRYVICECRHHGETWF